jgi:hypothetical protein
VFHGRAEAYRGPLAKIVTLRAVERFETILPLAASLVAPSGRFALLIGKAQLARLAELTPGFAWPPAIPIPQSANRVLAVGITPPHQVPIK